MASLELRTCVFCERILVNENRSKEHVFPRWLLDFLQIREDKIQPTHFTSQGNRLTSRDHTLDELLAGRVCADCNGGWMNDLELQAIPILKPLIKGNKVVVELDDFERQILARWAAKTSFTLNSASNFLKNVPNEHFKYISTNSDSLPIKVYTYGQQHHGKRAFYWMQSATWIVNGELDDEANAREILKSSSYKIALQFGKLILLIAYLPIVNIYPVLWKGVHIPLIPKTGKCAYYDSDDFSWSDSEKALREFHIGLEAKIMNSETR